MTTLAIIADLHGNLPALEAVATDIARQNVDQVIVAGDALNWGPFSPEVVQRILDERWAVIRGNHEMMLLAYGTPRAPAEWDDLDAFPIPGWLHRQMPAALRLQIACWPDTLVIRPPDGPPLRVVHGSPRDHSEPIYPSTTADELAPMLATIAETTLVTAHTHIPLDQQIGRWHILNPGSAGHSLDGTLEARYLLLHSCGEQWVSEFRSLPYDRTKLFAEFARQNFAAACGVIGQLVIDEFACARPRIAPFLRWRQETAGDAPFNAATLARFRTCDPELFMPHGHQLPAATTAPATPN